MFALRLRIEIATRVLLIAVVLFNTSVPTSALAKSMEQVENNYQVSAFSSLNAGMAERTENVLYQVASCQSSGDLTIADGETCSLEAGSYTYNSIHVQTGGTLLIKGDPALNQGVTINATNLTIEPGGKIDANGAGYVPSTSWVDGTGPGGGKRATEGGGGGAGYGGNGQSWAGSGGLAYGSVTTPTDLGSSGGPGRNFFGTVYVGGAGGGAIHLNVTGTLTVNGEIAADGENGSSSGGGGGSGGSIWIETNTLAGNGIVHANGGGNSSAGGGAGGRIAVSYATSTFSTDAQHVYARGNKTAGPGTVYLMDITSEVDKLLVDNGGNTTVTYAVLPTGTYSYDQIEVSGKGVLRISGTSSNLTITNETIAGDGTGRLEVEGVVHAPQNLALTNVDLAIMGDLADTQTINLSGAGKMELYASSPLNNGINTFTDITVGNGTTLRLVSYNNGNTNYTDDRGVTLNVTNLTVAMGGKIDASGTGYTSLAGWVDGTGPGGGKRATGGGGGGAGYGGTGQDAAGEYGSIAYGGATYGSVNNPADLGSSGGTGRNGIYGYLYAGGSGGGAIHLNVSETLMVNGEIAADGSNGNWSGGGGSGGSIWIEANTLAGSGTVHANGSGNDAGGKGAGGRIAVYAENSNHTIVFSAQGGPGYEITGMGTVYLDSIDLANSTVEISPSQVTADGSSLATVTVTVKNQDGYPAPNKAVELGPVSGSGLYIDNVFVNSGDFRSIGSTNANGQVTATLKTFKAGIRTIGALVNGTMIAQQDTVEFLPGPVSANFSDLIPLSAAAPADGQTPINVTVTAFDAYNNLVPNASVVWQTTGSAVITPQTQLTDENGKATAQVVDPVAESVTISVIVDGEELTDKSNLTFTGADLALAANAAPEALADTSLEYHVTVHNVSGISVQNVVLQVQLPQEVTFTSHTAPVQPTTNGQTLSWDLGTFDAGEKLSFTIFGRISPSAALGSTLTMQANVSSSTADGNPGNNSATVNTTVVDGHNFAATIDPSNTVLGIGGTAVYEIKIQNTGLSADQYDLSLSGLEPAWYTLSDTTVSLSPGETSNVRLEVQIDSCSQAGALPFEVRVTGAAEQEVKTLAASVTYQAGLILSGLAPSDGAQLSSQDVTINWRSDVSSTGTLTVIKPGGGTETFSTPSGVFSSVLVPGLDRNATYEWFVEAVSSCGTTTSSHRQFTVGNGIVFVNRSQNISVNRDYNQRVNITVRNDDDLEHTLKVSIPKELNPYEDLLVNFVDSGSQDQTVTLQPHTSRDVTLAIHTQDAQLDTYDLSASLVADEDSVPIYDNMSLHLTVLREGNFTIEEDEAAFDPVTLGRTYVITNHGKPITDLSLKAIDPVTGLPAKIFLQPSLDHARIETGQSIRVVAYPVFTEEDAVAHASLVASIGSEAETASLDIVNPSRVENSQMLWASYPLTPALASGASVSVGQAAANASSTAIMSVDPGDISFELEATGAGVTKQWTGAPTSCGTSRQILPVTIQDCAITFETHDWYCTNRPSIKTPIRIPAFLQSSNITSAALNVTFQQQGNVLPHSTVIDFNDVLIGTLADMIPNGPYSFDVPVDSWKNGIAGLVTQSTDTQTYHSNNGHYSVATGYNLEVNVDQATTYVCADSQASAQQVVQSTYACMASTIPVFNPGTDVPLFSTHNAGQSKTHIKATVESDGDISNITCTYNCKGDPINTQTGVFSFTLADLSFPTTAGDLVFQRSYSSGVLETPGVLGYGWTHNHDARLIFPTDPGGMEGYVLFQGVIGNQYLFKIEADGSFTSGPGVIATLTKSSAAPVTYTLTSAQQAIFRFDANGRLTARQDAQGHAFDYDYDTQGRLVKVSADPSTGSGQVSGVQFIEIDYNQDGQIDTVRDHTNRQVSYGYDGAGNLIAATDVLGQTWTYVYDAEHHMTEAKDPAGTQTVKTLYDAKGRAYRQLDGEGNLIVLIIYNSDGTTAVYDALGNKDEHRYNERNIATQTTDPLGRIETSTFDGNFRPTEITNSANQTLQMTWSADGVNLLSKIDPEGNQTEYDYDSLNNLTSVTDARNFTTTYTYDGKLLTSSTDALNGETTYTYTPEGYLESVTDTAGRVTSYTYDSFGRRISMTDPSGNTWRYTYDALGRLIDTTDPSTGSGGTPRGRTTHNEYNAAGQLIRVTQNFDPGRPQNDENLYNIVTAYEYDVRGNQIAVTDTYGRRTQYVYDDADRLLQTIDPLGNTTVNTYDAAGRLISTTDPLGHKTTYQYDATGRLVKTINALGYASGGTTTFNVSTNTSTVTDILGRKTVFHYDALGRVVKVVDPLGNFTTTTYDPNGNVATRTDQLGRTTYYAYDALNRLIKTTDPNGGVTETFYDEAGNRIATEDALDHRTTYTYDAVGRLVATTDPLGRTTRTEYDAYGRRAATIDAAGHRTTYTYDALDRLIAVTDDDGNTTYTSYDALGNVLASTDANGHATTTVYDALNRPQTTTDAEGNTTTNTYDAAGNLSAATNALGQTTSYTYDALDRQIAVTDPLGNMARSYYDTLGNLFDTVDANGVVTHYVYDELNRQKAVILNYKPGVDADAETNVRYEFIYNEVGNRVSVKDPKGNITTYGYDALNRVTSKSDPLGNTWSYTYDLAGNRVSTTDARNQTIQYTYDAAGQLTDIDYPGAEPDVTFTYDLNGQRTGMTDGLGTTTWTYNDINRLTSVTDAFGQMIGYGYDAAGNRTGLTYPDGKVVTYAFDDVNQLIGVTDWDSQTTGYTYDAAGRLASVSRPNGVASQYGYDDAGRLIELQHTLDADTLASYNYVYDPAGNRTQAIENLQNPQQFASLGPDRMPAAKGLYKPLLLAPATPTWEVPPPIDDTPTASATPSQTQTSTPTSTNTSTPTTTETATSIATDTHTPTATETETPTATASPSFTPTETLTPTLTATETATPSQTPTETETATPTFTPTPYPSGPVTIDYTYDALHRLTGATYSDGRSFGYTYDPAGNVLELQENLGPGTVVTTYTYDAANQLNTAQKEGTTWQYTYDANGSLISDGVKTYAYNSANRLITVDDPSSTVNLSYNGLGQRLSMDAAGVIAHYVMDGDQPITADSAGDTTFYLYGLGAIAEKTNAWSYSLPDGTNTPRQLSNLTGELTLSARYTPWGDTLDTYGTGNFTFGYFGGVLDAATGLLYVGNGQYYDPETGRFLTRDAKPNSTNPYVPWDPTGAIIGPLAAMALFFGKKRKRDKWDSIIILLVLSLSVGLGLAACKVDNPTGQPINVTVTQPQGSPTATAVWQTPTATGTATFTPPAPINTLVPTCTLTVGEGIHEITKPYGGNEIMALYNKMKNYSSGWWQKHPDQSKYKFTFEVFIGLLIVHEGAGQEIFEKLIAELVSQQLYIGSWNPAYCSMGQCSQNAAANQWGAQSQSIHGLVDPYVRQNKDIKDFPLYHDGDNPNKEVEAAWKYGNMALHPSSLNLDVDNALSVCGNDPAWVKKINKAAEDPKNEMKRYAYKEYRDGNPRSIYYFTGVPDGAAVYASKNQQNCWKNNKNCYVVPNPVIVNNPATGNFGDN